MGATYEIIAMYNATPVVISSCRSVGSGKVVFITGASKGKVGFLVLGDFAIVRVERTRRWKISVIAENMGRDLQPQSPQRSNGCLEGGV